MKREYEVYHELKCSECGTDLTWPDSIEVSVSNGERVIDSFHSYVDETGELQDRANYILNGYHSGSVCRNCGHDLDEVEPEE